MPADIVVMLDCASNYGVFRIPSSGCGRSRNRPQAPDHYVVSFNGSEGPAHCTCPAYQFSGEERHCKHIEAVWNGACVYNPQWCDGHQPVKFKPIEYTYDAVVPGGKCPNCHGPVVAVRRAV